MAAVFFQIPVFLAFGALSLTALAFIAARIRDTELKINNWWYLSGFIFLGGLAMFTARNYVFPNKPVFDNSKYHILEHNGFQFEKKLALVQSRYPDISLWDNKTGRVLLERDSSTIKIEIEKYYEPFYLSDKNSEYFKLRNNIIDKDVSNGFILESSDTIIYQLKIVYNVKGRKGKCLYLSRTNAGAGFDTSTFTHPIYRGYPLLDILLSTPHLQLTDDLRFLLDKSLLVRDSIKIESRNTAAEITDKNKSSLYFFPQNNFYSTTGISFDGQNQLNPDTTFHFSVSENSIFYSGTGFSKTDVFTVALEDKDDIRLNFILPKMQALRDSSGQLFITSSLEEVKNHNLKGGYLYNIFESPKNWNNINATLRYNIGSAREAMFFKIKDLYATSQEKEIFPADSLIVLKSLNTDNNFRWLFQFRNLRETNSFQLKHINWFIFLFIFFLSLRLLLDTRRVTVPFRLRETLLNIDHLGKVTAVELSVYVVIFCFSIVRLILVWRMSTFVPIEDIDPGRFYKLRDGYSVFTWTLLLVTGCFLLLIFIKLVKNSPEFKEWLFKNKCFFLFISILAIASFFIFHFWFNFSVLVSSGTALIIFISQFFFKKYILKAIVFTRKIWIGFLKQIRKIFHTTKTAIYKIRFVRPIIGWCYKHLISSPARSKILLYFMFIVFILYGISNLLPESFARLLNIPLPVLSYFIFDFFLLRTEDNIEIPSITPRFQSVYRYIYFKYARITLWLIAFTYFAFQDSGFSIIFLLYGLIHHIFSRYFFAGPDSNKSKWRPWVYILFITVGFYCFLHFQSEIILSIFNHTLVWVIITAILLLTIGYLIASNPFFTNGKYAVAGVCMLLLATILVIGTGRISEWLNENKGYVKYRAEIQLPNKGVEDLIKENKFKSADITYILRSAHNQWFINLYNSNLPSKYFTLQPHFNQGSSFTTQTTDLVVTRYLIAEHPKVVMIILMLLLFLLPVVYSFTLNLKEPKINFSVLGVFILLFSIALFVYLSATNRVVFFGQDFPFLSLTSKIAILFPLLIFLIAIFNSWDQRDADNDINPDLSHKNKILFPISIALITLSCIFFLHPKNKEKDPSHFNISQLIDKTAIKVDAINDEFNDYQFNNRDHFRKLGIDSLISSYARDESQSEKLHLSLNDTTDNFVSSLMYHFIDPHTNKWDANELIHIRKRGAYYNITVNRKYYFISSFKEEEDKWSGNLIAAKTENKFGFLNKGKNLFIPNEKNEQIIPNILDLPANKKFPELKESLKDLYNNIFIMKLDPSWTDNGEPLYLIKSDEGDFEQNKANFHIYNDTVTINGNYKYPAIRLLQGDLLAIDIKKERGYETVLKWSIISKSENYLAKNLWLNGKQNLFYPLGKEFIWSYNFANLVSQTWSDSSNIKNRNSNLRVSIDYDLTRALYDIIDRENKSKLDISDAIKERLIAFRDIDWTSKINPNNSSEIYLSNNKLFINNNSKYRNNPVLKEAIAVVNKTFHPINPDSYNNDLVKVINEVTEKKFDYSTVVLDGYGRIRTLFDYSRFSKTDPNNIKDFNRFLSELYKQSSVSTEKDYFGNKSLSVINPGPGSSFKPIAFTAISSKINFGWENLKVEPVNASNILRLNQGSKNNKPGVAFYGGKSFKELKESYWNLDAHNFYDAGLNCNKYLVKSNNLFHSVIIFLGSQSESTLKAIRNDQQYDILFKDISSNNLRDSSTFPVINFQNHTLIFDPSKWLQKRDFFGKSSSVLANGLQENFSLSETSLGRSDTNYFNSFGSDSLFNTFFSKGNSSSFIWSYPEQSTFNQLDRTVSPRIRNGLIQPSLGSFPLKVTPLNMATMGMRLTTLNRAKYITTLSPDSGQIRQYQFFNLDYETWDTVGFVKYHQQNVLRQLFEVVNGDGTAAGLKGELSRYTKQGYSFYAKTGTINIEDDSDERGKHLLVVITKNRRIDDLVPLTVEELKHLRYYVLFMSYHGIDKDEFAIGNFGKIISAVMESELFTKYMNEGQ